MVAAHRVLLVTSALVLGACGDDPPPALPSTPAATFVGRASCVTCHEAAAHAWAGSHHDLAMQPADASTVLGDFADATFEYAGITSTFSRRDDKFVVRTDGPDGALRDYEVRYTFGVTPLQQYLVETERGRFQALEIAWDSRPVEAGGQRWFHLYPDEAIDHRDELHWTGRAMNWNYMCATCHSTDYRRGYDLATDTFASTWAEIDVSCEACHGAGSNHVAWANAGAKKADTTRGLTVRLHDRGVWQFAPDAKIAQRSTPRTGAVEVETCAPCHSRRTQCDESPWHGAPYLDRYDPSLLEAGLYQPDGQILDEVYVYGSFVQSRMYHAGVTCSDCHDPHSLKLHVTGNALCAQCHLPSAYDVPAHHHHAADSPGASCVACHMRARNYMVVDPRRDHSFRIPRPEESVTIGTPNACQDCHAKEGARWAADAVAGWRGDRPAPAGGYGRALFDARLGKPAARDALVALATDATQPALGRATALAALGEFASTLDIARVRAVFSDPDPLVRRGAAELLDALPNETRIAVGSELLRDPIRTVRAAAGRAFATTPRTAIDGRAADDALRNWLEFQLANRDQPWAHVNLGVLFAETGRTADAEQAYRTALRIEPRAIQARVNLADLMREAGNDAASEAVLRDGLTADPTSAELHHALGLTLVRREQRDAGIAELAKATELRPESARFAYVHAVALHSTEHPERAIDALEVALQRHPWDRDLLFGMTSFLRDGGDLERALEFAQRLVELEPAAQTLVDELQRSRR